MCDQKGHKTIQRVRLKVANNDCPPLTCVLPGHAEREMRYLQLTDLIDNTHARQTMWSLSAVTSSSPSILRAWFSTAKLSCRRLGVTARPTRSHGTRSGVRRIEAAASKD